MLLARIDRIACQLDERLRHRDLTNGRTAGGFLDRKFGIHRHTSQALLLPVAVVFFSVLATPGAARFGIAIAASAATLFLLRILFETFCRQGHSLRWDLYSQLGIVLAVVIAIGVFGGSEYSKTWPYQHLLLALVLAACLTLLVADFLSHRIFRGLSVNSTFGESLRKTELFAGRGASPDLTLSRLLIAFCVVPFRAPLALLLPPAIAALLAPPAWLIPIVLAAFLLNLALLVLSGINERFGAMWALLTASFMQTESLLLSLFVIALGIARLFQVSYVTTLFDTAAGWVIVTVLLSLYTLAWWFSYWTNRLLSDQLIRIISPAAKSGEVKLSYEPEPGAVRTKVPGDRRVFQLHGSSRFIVIRDSDSSNPTTYFHSYPALEAFGILAACGAAGGRAEPTLLQLTGRAHTYRSLITAILGILLVAAGLLINRGPQAPELVTDLTDAGGISVASLLAKPADDHTVYVVAASGGGTRAALFTAALLEGLATRGQARNVVLASGVSGGGAALAYFTGFREQLTEPYRRAAWDRFFIAMQESYIRDVLDRASEMRMIREGRLGMLLRESFDRHWGSSATNPRLDNCASMPSGNGCQFGLILNSTLAGHLNLQGRVPNGMDLSEVEPDYRKETSSNIAGGRLIFTNLKLSSVFAASALEPGGLNLPVVVRGPGVRLAHGAALNANFPPVFANAAIDTNNQDRYWVTDGGAADNRGLEMLLFSVLNGLKELKPEQIPNLRIIVADASGYSDGYAQDRGVSSALGAGAHFASALDSKLKTEIELLYKSQPNRFAFHYVYMPRQLRVSDSFGTHWMLQPWITVHKKHTRPTLLERFLSFFEMGENPGVTISGEEMIDVLRSLMNASPVSFQDGTPLQLSAGACTVRQWARDDQSPEKWWEIWKEVTKELGSIAPGSVAGCP